MKTGPLYSCMVCTRERIAISFDAGGSTLCRAADSADSADISADR